MKPLEASPGVGGSATLRKPGGRWSVGAVGVVALALVAGCGGEPLQEGDYVARITAARAMKDAALKSGPEPVPDEVKDKLLPLAYYPPEPAYNVPAILTPSGETQPLQMVYSDGVIRDVLRVGTLEFTLKGQSLRLAAFVEVAAPNLNHLFVPFGDRTNGADTYPAGRLLDLNRTGTGYYELDFNLAYNPNCYFNPMYSCPVPPKENDLTVEILAGEKTKAGN